MKMLKNIYKMLPFSADTQLSHRRLVNAVRECRLRKWHPVSCSEKGKRILVIDQHVPEPDRGAGARSLVHWMSFLLKQGMVVTFWPCDLKYDPTYTSQLEKMGIEVIYRPISGPSPSLTCWLKQNGQHVSYVLLNRPEVAFDYLKIIRKWTTAKVLYYGHDIHHARFESEMILRRADKTLQQKIALMKEMEHRVWKGVDVIYYPSAEEVDYVSQWLLKRGVNPCSRVVPVYVYQDFCQDVSRDLSSRKNMMIVGGFSHAPNLDGVNWFVNEILPNIIPHCPDIHLYVIGSNPPAEVMALQGQHVSVMGHVSDQALNQYYEEVRVSVAPLRFGAGMKGKVVEALRHGVPVVTTSIGAQGLSAVGDALAVTDDPRTFAEQVISLLCDNERWLIQASAGVSAAKEYFSTETLYHVFAQDMVFDGDLNNER